MTAARTGAPNNKYRKPRIGTCYLHTVIDDHSRVAYVEAHDDETKETATRVLTNAVAWFAERGVTVQRVLSDNGRCYRSNLWRDTCAELGITPKKTRPYRPQTNGKIERFHRTLAEGWAFKKLYSSETARLAALPSWIHQHNHHRPHSAIGKAAPITRLDNLAGHHTWRRTRRVPRDSCRGSVRLRHPRSRSHLKQRAFRGEVGHVRGDRRGPSVMCDFWRLPSARGVGWCRRGCGPGSARQVPLRGSRAAPRSPRWRCR